MDGRRLIGCVGISYTEYPAHSISGWRDLKFGLNGALSLFSLAWLCLVMSLFYGWPAHASSSGWVQSTHLKAELVSEYRQVQRGQTVTLALHTEHEPHWHSYWLNPGDSGLATSINWQLPPGVRAGAIEWPTPQAIRIPPLVNYGYENQTILLTQVSLPAH